MINTIYLLVTRILVVHITQYINSKDVLGGGGKPTTCGDKRRALTELRFFELLKSSHVSHPLSHVLSDGICRVCVCRALNECGVV